MSALTRVNQAVQLCRNQGTLVCRDSDLDEKTINDTEVELERFQSERWYRNQMNVMLVDGV